MINLSKYTFFLFDFDGLLVNTEEVHFSSYKRALFDFGLFLDWDFQKYCLNAHYSSEALKEAILADVDPQRKLSWESLYKKKQGYVKKTLEDGEVPLMEGVEKLLLFLEQRSATRVVVTHSPRCFVEILKKRHPVLQTIPYFLTREDYEFPKPDPECYQRALSLYRKDGEMVVGFEDTPRGLAALMQVDVDPVLITKISYPEIGEFKNRGVTHLHSLKDVL